MSIAEKLTTIAENEQKVYDAGIDKIIKAFTNNYTRTDYAYAFYHSDFSNIVFPPNKPTACNQMFRYYAGEYIPTGFDLSSAVDSGQWFCQLCPNLKVFPDIGYPIHARYGGTWEACSSLEKIEIIRTDENSVFDYTFSKCWALKDVTFEGVIGQNISFGDSSGITRETLLSYGNGGVFGKLKDYFGTGITHTITLHQTTKDKLEQAELAIATQKGWTIA